MNATYTSLAVLLALLALFFIGRAALQRYQRRQVFKPEKVSGALPNDPGDLDLAYDDVRFASDDGRRLHGWWVPCEGATNTVLMCHGNAGNIAHRVRSVAFYQQLGLNVFIFDYRGYGLSEGRPSEPGLYMDAYAAWRYLTEERRIAPAHIVILGRSLGGAVASHLALRTRPAAVLIESTFTSIADMARARFKRLPLWRLSWLSFDNRSRIGKIKAPLLLVHSVEDEVIPYAHGEALHAISGSGHQLLTIRGSHSGGYAASGDVYAKPIREFFRNAGVTLAAETSVIASP